MQGNQSQTHWAFIAGVMDSDGCFMITRHKRKTQRKDYPHMVDQWSWTYMPSVKVCQREPQIVHFLRDVMGLGTITLDGARKSRPNSSPMYQWGIRNREQLPIFLRNVIPFLMIKKERAQFLLDYCDVSPWISRTSRYHGLTKEELIYREESYQKMREFNGKKVGATTEFHGRESVSDSLNL